MVEQPLSQWLEEHLPEGARLGYDPWLAKRGERERLEKVAASRRGTLVPLDPNPIDAIWPDRPPRPIAPVRRHELAHAGEDALGALLEGVVEGLLVEGDDDVALFDGSAFGGEVGDLRPAAQLGEDAVVLDRAELAILRDDDLQLTLLRGDELDRVGLGAEAGGALPLGVERRSVNDRRRHRAADHAQARQPLDRCSQL